MTVTTFVREHKFRSAGSEGLQALSKLLFAYSSRVVGADTSGITTDGATQTIAAYGIDMTELTVMVGGVYDTIAALVDQDLLADITSYDLAGDAAVALTADGKTCLVALAVFLVNNALVLRGFFGAEAANGSEVEPSEAQIYAAMVLAGETNYLDTPGIVTARFLVQRTAVDTMVLTHYRAADVDALKQERVRAGCGV